jgi:hypothetical protein
MVILAAHDYVLLLVFKSPVTGCPCYLKEKVYILLRKVFQFISPLNGHSPEYAAFTPGFPNRLLQVSSRKIFPVSSTHPLFGITNAIFAFCSTRNTEIQVTGAALSC